MELIKHMVSVCKFCEACGVLEYLSTIFRSPSVLVLTSLSVTTLMSFPVTEFRLRTEIHIKTDFTLKKAIQIQQVD